MSREIKFRAIAASGVMVHGDLITQGYYAEPKFGLIGCGIQLKSGYTERIQDDKTVGQFTGLHDKNGTEIYEGDIIKHNVNRFEVKYSTNQHVLLLRRVNDKGMNWRSLGWLENVSKYCEVIGNIHYNPELIGMEATNG